MSSSGKRYNDTNANHLYDKSPRGNTGTGASQRKDGNHPSLTKPRGRFSSGTTNAKLAVPRPVNLPSLKKEHQGNDPNAQLVQPAGLTGWQRQEEMPETGTWSQHVAQRSGGSEENAVATSPTANVLDQEEFPTLEAAAQTKTRTSKSIQSPETTKEWSADDPAQQPAQQHASFPPSWAENGHYGSMPMPYGAVPAMHYPGYVQPGADPFLHAPFYPRPHFYPPSGRGMRPGYRPEYFGPHGEGIYHPYMPPMYPPHVHPGYGHPDMFPEQGAFPMHPMPQHGEVHAHTQAPNVEPSGWNADKEEFETELQTRGQDAPVQAKQEAEHPKTPDNLSGEGSVRLIRRQPSGDEQSNHQEGQNPILRKISLPRGGSSQLYSRPSEELDWGAQVDAEEKARERKEIKILTRPMQDKSDGAEDQKAVEEESHPRQPVRESREEHTSEGRPRGRWAVSQSPMRYGPLRSDESADPPLRRSGAASDTGTPKTWRSREQHQFRGRDNWRGRGRSGRPRSFDDRGSHPFRDAQLHGGWNERPDHRNYRGSFRGRGDRGRGDRGRFGRGRFMGHGRGSGERSPMSAPARMHLFPGRGFRPKGEAPRSGPVQSDAEAAAIQFGQFSTSLKGDFDPFSATRPDFKSDRAERRLNVEVDNWTTDGLPSKDPQTEAATEPSATLIVPRIGTVPSRNQDKADALTGEEAIDTPGSFSRRSPRSFYRGRGRNRGHGRWQSGSRDWSSERSHMRRDAARSTASMDDVSFRNRADQDWHLTPRGRAPRDGHRHWDRDHDRHGDNFMHRGGWRGGRRGRGRDHGRDRGGRTFHSPRHSAQDQNPPSTPNNAKMQWVPKKPTEDSAKDSQNE